MVQGISAEVGSCVSAITYRYHYVWCEVMPVWKIGKVKVWFLSFDLIKL
jgi:hypothetical protein